MAPDESQAPVSAAPADAPGPPAAAPASLPDSRAVKVALLSVGEALSNLVQLVMFAVLARVLTVTDYATYRQAILALLFAMPLLQLGLPQALYYFLTRGGGRARAVLWENLILQFAMGAVFTLLLVLGGNQLLARGFHNPGLAYALPAPGALAALRVPPGGRQCRPAVPRTRPATHRLQRGSPVHDGRDGYRRRAPLALPVRRRRGGRWWPPSCWCPPPCA